MNELEKKGGCFLVVLAVCILALIVLVFASVTTINTGERGVVTRLGKLSGVQSEGLNFKIPFVDSVTKMSIREQNFPLKMEVSSKDMQTIAVEVSLIYSVDPALVGHLYQRFGEGYQDIVVRPTLAEVTNAIVAEYPIETFVERRAEISQRINEAFVEKVNGSGLKVQSLLITNHDFSDEFNHSIEAKKVAEQQALKAKYDLDRVKLEAQAQNEKNKSLTPTVLQELFIEKWDGKLPNYWGGGSLPLPVMNTGGK